MSELVPYVIIGVGTCVGVVVVIRGIRKYQQEDKKEREIVDVNKPTEKYVCPNKHVFDKPLLLHYYTDGHDEILCPVCNAADIQKIGVLKDLIKPKYKASDFIE